jgi:hypothetical protein
MANFNEALFAFNTLEKDPNMRSACPYVMQLAVIDPGAVTDGVVTVDIDSPFGLGLGTVFGIISLNSIFVANKGLLVSAVASGTAGKITITINSTDATDDVTDHAAFYVLLFGQILPTTVA